MFLEVENEQAKYNLLFLRMKCNMQCMHGHFRGSSRKIWLMDEEAVKNQTKVWLIFLETKQHQEKYGRRFSIL